MVGWRSVGWRLSPVTSLLRAPYGANNNDDSNDKGADDADIDDDVYDENDNAKDDKDADNDIVCVTIVLSVSCELCCPAVTAQSLNNQPQQCTAL